MKLSKKQIRQLHWDLLHYKCLYYVFGYSAIEDWNYDTLERLYEKASGKEMEVDFDKDKTPNCFIWRIGEREVAQYVHKQKEWHFKLINGVQK